MYKVVHVSCISCSQLVKLTEFGYPVARHIHPIHKRLALPVSFTFLGLVCLSEVIAAMQCMAKGIESETRQLYVVHFGSLLSSSCSMLCFGLKSVLHSKYHEGCCCRATFDCMGKSSPGLPMCFQSSCQGLIAQSGLT